MGVQARCYALADEGRMIRRLLKNKSLCRRYQVACGVHRHGRINRIGGKPGIGKQGGIYQPLHDSYIRLQRILISKSVSYHKQERLQHYGERHTHFLHQKVEYRAPEHEFLCKRREHYRTYYPDHRRPQRMIPLADNEHAIAIQHILGKQNKGEVAKAPVQIFRGESGVWMPSAAPSSLPCFILIRNITGTTTKGNTLNKALWNSCIAM
jgi:hypothetical protein